MRKITPLVIVIFVLGMGASNFALYTGEKDIQAIKKAVKKNPNFRKGDEAMWLKVLITEDDTDKVKVKITLPLKLVELFIKATEGKDLQIDHEGCDIDLGELFAELKRAGPMALIEVYEDGETIKIWLE